MPTTQMNTRIDEELKTAGGEWLRALGYTPSQAIRLLWECAAHGAVDLKPLRQVMSICEDVADKEKEERHRRMRRAIAKAPSLHREICDAIGIDSIPPMPALSDKELRELAYLDRAIEKGWLD